ncbi:MAG: hypothetical protein JSR39_08315 [Verrucomicrobia bacterium]|nr:hypothetical protein [Verrucomicrobiota bacterium]
MKIADNSLHMTNDKTLTIPPCSILSSPLEIYFGSDRSSLDKHFRQKERKTFQSLFEQVQSEPSAAKDKLIKFAQEHPQVPMVYNLLAFCHIQLKDIASADKAIEEAFLQFPDYLFAKINYADLLLRKKKWRQVPEVFDQTLDLSLLYPDRKSFHFSEVRGFMTAIGYYYHERGKRKLALEAFRIAVQADPTHPSVLALEKALFYNPLLRFIKSLIRNRD